MKKNQRNAKKRGRYDKKCPVEVGNEYEVDITETTPNRSGIARIKRFLIFVENANPGDHITVKIIKIDPISADAVVVT